ncbi:hypothetical protein OFC63_28420, partial [Escherichia coli]|nr:hypothetical protein [Escherichia coli]
IISKTAKGRNAIITLDTFCQEMFHRQIFTPNRVKSRRIAAKNLLKPSYDVLRNGKYARKMEQKCVRAVK